jgi:hypothetical protein
MRTFEGSEENPLVLCALTNRRTSAKRPETEIPSYDDFQTVREIPSLRESAMELQDIGCQDSPVYRLCDGGVGRSVMRGSVEKFDLISRTTGFI